MSSIKLSPNASGTGEFTIAAPNSNTNRTLTLPDQTGTVLTNAGPFTANASASAGAVTVDASGNVGIGTSSPQRRLEVSDSTDAQVRFTGQSSANGARLLGYSNSDAVSFGVGGSTGGQQGAATAYIGSLTNVPLVFTTNGSDRARIDSSGNLLVGTTTDNITATGVRLRGDNIQVAKSGDWSLRTGRTTSTGIVQEIYYNSSRVGDIATNGTGTSYNSASDYRLKENAQPMTGALARVALLKPCTYTWKINGSRGEGFIAHELQEVVPDAVSGVKDAVDDEGNIVPQSIDTSFLVATLTAAIQELNAKVEAQAAEIAALKGAQ